MRLSTKEMILAALFTALTVAGSKINFLLPIIPVTFQPIIVMLAGSLLGRKAALMSQVVYILLGISGMPVFAKPLAGPAYILTPSFGYLIGFAAAAYIIGLIVEKFQKKTVLIFIGANMLGLLIIYFFGVTYLYGLMNLYLGNPMSILQAIKAGMLIFITKDIILGVAVSLLSYSVFNKLNSKSRNAH